jgi:hypothetical protein
MGNPLKVFVQCMRGYWHFSDQRVLATFEKLPVTFRALLPIISDHVLGGIEYPVDTKLPDIRYHIVSDRNIFQKDCPIYKQIDSLMQHLKRIEY